MLQAAKEIVAPRCMLQTANSNQISAFGELGKKQDTCGGGQGELGGIIWPRMSRQDRAS
jgi:hypothetical protein